MPRAFSGLLIIPLLVALTSAAGAADAATGEKLARRWCVTCHLVAEDQTKGSTEAPPFSAIAKRPDFNDAELAQYLLLQHPQMPDMNLSRDEAADLVAYIKTQRN
jgi:mono/diheme cytochrome c family protein